MPHRTSSLLVAGLLTATVVSGLAVADPPRPGTEANGLTENESATLWSRDADAYLSQEKYRQRYGENRSVVHQIANGTDITFKRPPATAATWTRHDFTDLDAGGTETSIHPPHAALEDGVFIADAHATIFAVHPSTRGHLEGGETPRYVAPNGTLRGFVDYRVRVPTGRSTGSRTIEWALTEHEIDAVRVTQDGEPIATGDGSQTPALAYQLQSDCEATLTLEADISVRLRKTVRTDHGNRTSVDITYETESLTVSDSIDVEVYDLSVEARYAAYPDGDTGVAVFQSRPWQGYTLTADGRSRVRGVWRFYTARNTDWDTLVESNQTGRTRVESDALPVFVHAYPSRIGPRVEPVRDGPVLTETWGINRTSPAATIGENITVDNVNRSYTTTYGLAVRADSVDRDALNIGGIVRGVNASIVEPAGGTRSPVRESSLTVAVLERTASQATLRVELRDARTGAPITVGDDRDPVGGNRSRSGYVTVAGQRVATNDSGVAILTIEEPGIYTARYHPGSWLDNKPAYVGDSATVRWHPLTTIDGWFALLFAVGWQLLPFAVMFYAGTRLLRLTGFTDRFHQEP